MQSEERHDDVEMNPADRELEAALRSLSPTRTTAIDPIAAAFAAGRQSAQTQVRLWQVAAAAVLMIAVGSWLIPAGDDGGSGVVVVTAPPETVAVVTSAPVASPPSGHSMLSLQQTVRERGVDGLPETELPTIRNLRVADFF
jgi:hypothetical protein